MKKIRRDDFLPDFFYALFLERSLERFRHGFLHDAKDILDDCVVHVTAVNDAAAVLREEELLRRLVLSLSRPSFSISCSVILVTSFP